MADVMTLEKKDDKYEDNSEEKSPFMIHYILMLREGFEGDYLRAKSKTDVLTYLFEHSDSAESMIFSDSVTKIGRYNENVRHLILTNRCLYLMDQPNKFLSRWLLIGNIEFLTLARSHGQLVAIHMRSVLLFF